MTRIQASRPITARPVKAASAAPLAPFTLSEPAQRALSQLAAVRRELPNPMSPYSPDSFIPRYTDSENNIDHDRLQRALKGFARDVERVTRDAQDPTLRAIHDKADKLQDPSFLNLISVAARNREIYAGLKGFRVSAPNVLGADKDLLAALNGTQARLDKLAGLAGGLTAEAAAQKVAAEKARIDAQNPIARFFTGGRGKQRQLDEALNSLKALDVAARRHDAEALLAQVAPARQEAGAATTLTALDKAEEALKGFTQRAGALNGELDRQVAALESLKKLGV